MSKKLIYLIPFFLVVCLVLTSAAKADLVGWWRFDEGSGTIIYDSSGNGNDGILQGDTKWVAGKISGALEFNGTDSIVDIPYSPDMTPSEGTTMSAWVFPTDTSRSCIVGQFEGYGMALFTGLQLKSVIWGSDWVMSDVTIPVNEWSHIAMTWDVANAERMIFLNGELVSLPLPKPCPTGPQRSLLLLPTLTLSSGSNRYLTIMRGKTPPRSILLPRPFRCCLRNYPRILPLSTMNQTALPSSLKWFSPGMDRFRVWTSIERPSVIVQSLPTTALPLGSVAMARYRKGSTRSKVSTRTFDFRTAWPRN